MKKILMILLIIAGGVILPQASSAQVDPPPDPVDTPIDGGLSVLLGAGVVYGIKKVKENRKKKMEEKNTEK